MKALFRPSSAALLLAVLAACGSDDEPREPDPCAGATGTCVAFRSGTSEATIAGAIAQAQPGTTFAFGRGTFRFTNSLEVVADGVTIRGAGREATTLDFGGTVGPEGIGASGDDFTVSDLRVIDVAGDCIKVTGADGVTIRNVRTEWTSADEETHGGYGIYPVQSSNILIEGCYAAGARDTGIYVGQSDNIVVRDNEAVANVAGIEIENSTRADVHGNDVHGNAGGILAFNLPGLQVVPETNAVRIFDNRIVDNDGANFAPGGNIVAEIPSGTGIIVLANRDVEIFDNVISGNASAAVAVVSYRLVGTPPEGFDPDPANVWVHGNAFDGNGAAPDIRVDLGLLLAAISANALDGAPIPNHAWDGYRPDGAPAGDANPIDLCIGAEGTGVLNLNASVDPTLNSPVVDHAPFQCDGDGSPLPAVTLP